MDNDVTVNSGGKVYAHFFSSEKPIEGEVSFITSDDAPLQVGMFERQAQYEVLAHKHEPRQLNLENVGEFLLIQKGSALVKVFDEDWNLLHEQKIERGDCVVFLRGGHALTMLESTRILEVKQGPYLQTENEKTFRDSKE